MKPMMQPTVIWATPRMRVQRLRVVYRWSVFVVIFFFGNAVQ